jgi:hypothetical protein
MIERIVEIIKISINLGINLSSALEKNGLLNCTAKPSLFYTVCIYLHHSFQDPPKLAANLTDEYKKLTIYRQVRNEIKAYLANELPNLMKGLK